MCCEIRQCCLTYVSRAISPTATGTAELISKIDNLFDCLNCSSLNSPKSTKHELKGSVHIQYIREMLELIRSIKVIDKHTNADVTHQLQWLKGLEMTLNGLLVLWNQLHSGRNLEYLLTKRLNQELWENFGNKVETLIILCPRISAELLEPFSLTISSHHYLVTTVLKIWTTFLWVPLVILVMQLTMICLPHHLR